VPFTAFFAAPAPRCIIGSAVNQRRPARSERALCTSFTYLQSNLKVSQPFCGRLVACVLESSMSAVFERRRRLIRVWAWTIIFAATLGVTPTQADTMTVNVDQAQVLKLPERVATIVIGNPLIADAALQSGGILVITGKGYGSTNLLALDRSGRVVMDKTVQVLGVSGGELVVVYKGIERESYSCAPDCERRITLGDSPAYFNATLSESGARTGQAQTSSQPH